MKLFQGRKACELPWNQNLYISLSIWLKKPKVNKVGWPVKVEPKKYLIGTVSIESFAAFFCS